MTKNCAFKVHFLRRLQERLNIDLTDREYDQFNKDCASRKIAKFQNFTHANRCFLRVHFRGFDFNIVFCNRTNRAVTLIPDTVRFVGNKKI
jgi:hypothetical protein